MLNLSVRYNDRQGLLVIFQKLEYHHKRYGYLQAVVLDVLGAEKDSYKFH